VVALSLTRPQNPSVVDNPEHDGRPEVASVSPGGGRFDVGQLRRLVRDQLLVAHGKGVPPALS
jgi:hypothetical protein